MRDQDLVACYAPLLLQRANVIGVGIGRKVTNGRRLDQPCLTVLVSKKLPLTALAVPDLIPRRVAGLPTDVIESGPIQPLEQVARLRPARPGCSIGHYRITAGTFGAVVYDLASGAPLILSNNHVVANSSNGRDRRATHGDPILQPGPYDGGRLSNDLIGHLERYIPLHFSRAQPEGSLAASNVRGQWRQLNEPPRQALLNAVDAAVVRPISADLVDPTILGLNQIDGVAIPELDMQVRKSGRTTGVTQGIILIRDVVLRVDYGESGDCIFTGQVVSDLRSAPGDSGSLIVDLANRAVGLLFAGGNNLTVFNPIQPVLDSLAVRF
jgi:hypothetical protein